MIQRVLLVGDVGGLCGFHVGDEAMLESNLALLRRLLPEARFTATSLDPSATRRFYGIDAVPGLRFDAVSASREVELQSIDGWLDTARSGSRELPEALQVLLETDLLVISGGGNLCSSWPGHILQRLALVRLARYAQIPVLIVGQTLGPVLCEVDQALVAEILEAASWLGLREASSVALALRLGVPLERIDFQLDDAITLSAAPCAPGVIPVNRCGPLVALTLHSLFAGAETDAWLDHLAAELDLLIEQTAAHILFIPHLSDLDEGVDGGDYAVGLALLGRLANPRSLTLLNVQASAQTLWLTRQADVVVSSRYHPLVFALTAYKPCLGLPCDRYTLVKLHGALSHAGREADLLPLAGGRWEGLGKRIIDLCERRYSAAQSAAWQASLQERSSGRERRLAMFLADLQGQSGGVGSTVTDLARLIDALARIVNVPELFSATREFELQQMRLIEHWQSTALEAERYVLDLKRELAVKERQLLALGPMVPQG